jgi:hypothetical protein
MKKVLEFGFIMLVALFGCDRDNDLHQINTLILNDTTEISYKEYLYNFNELISIYFDTVFNDSRCPIGAECKWEGNATTKFQFAHDNHSFLLDLNTNSQFQTDTIINGYKIELITLNPYPVIDKVLIPEEYKAKIIISDE